MAEPFSEILPIPAPRELQLPTRDDAIVFRVTPSRINPWRGRRADGSRFTGNQLFVMREQQMDEDCRDVIVVRSPSLPSEVPGDPIPGLLVLDFIQPVFVIPCPVLRRSRDRTRAQVIAADGSVLWINADGTLEDKRSAARGATISEKADYVRAESRQPAGDHHCHWPGCQERVPPAKWGCRRHWFALPDDIRTRIWLAFRPGQERSKTPSPEYVAAARAAQDWISEQQDPRGQQ